MSESRPPVLVTGGAGFIGSHVVDAFFAQGHRVVVVDDLTTGDPKRIPGDVRLVEADIRSAALEQLFREEGIEAVFHLAAQIDVRHSVADPIADAEINVLGTIRIAQAAIAAGRPLMLIDVFQTGTAAAPRDRSHRYFLTFNKSDDANRVQDILTALAFVHSQTSERIELRGLGNAGIWCLFAASVARVETLLEADLDRPVRRAVAAHRLRSAPASRGRASSTSMIGMPSRIGKASPACLLTSSCASES